MMVRFSAILTTCLLLAACASSPQKSGSAGQWGDPSKIDLTKFCETADCRGPMTVRVLRQDGTLQEVYYDRAYPIVQGVDWVTIFAGETIYLEAKASGDRLVNIRSVKQVTNPEGTLVFGFKQGATGRTDMMLAVKNPFPKHLKYSLAMQLLDRDGLFKTSSCPVPAGGDALELWPHPIYQLVITNFRLIDEGSRDFRCSN